MDWYALKRIISTRFHKPFPWVLSHLIINRCNAGCATCLWKETMSRPEDRGRGWNTLRGEPLQGPGSVPREGFEGTQAGELKTDEVCRLYREAAVAGFLELVVWGGEPFLRPDLGQILQTIQDTRLRTTVITNGSLLVERHGEILPYIDSLFISLDAASEAHDAIRGLPGLFDRIVKGIGLIQERYPRLKVMLMTVVSRLNQEELEGLVAIARRWRLPITFQSMNRWDYGPYGEQGDLARLALRPEESRQAFAFLQSCKREGYTVVNSTSYLQTMMGGANPYRCHYKKVVLRVESNGDILDCACPPGILGNVRLRPLPDLIRSPEYAAFLKRAEECRRCVDAGVVESSLLWELRPGALLNALRYAIRNEIHRWMAR